jgi:DNA-directed RNA polymerase subunit K/omega
MRSEQVFAAAQKIGNRFLLCRVTSVAARRLQKGQKPFTESINESLKLVASMAQRETKASVTEELRISPDHTFLHSEPASDPLTGDIAAPAGLPR